MSSALGARVQGTNSGEETADLDTWLQASMDELARIRHVLEGSHNARNPILYASICDSAEAVHLLTLEGHDPSHPNNEPLNEACRYGYTRVVQLLLSDVRVDPTRNRNECMRIAISHGMVEVVRALLIDGRIDPRSDDNFCLREAVLAKRHDVLEVLIQDIRVWYTPVDVSLIASSARVGDSDAVHILLSLPTLICAW